MAEYIYSNRDENQFWLEIMGDGALMLHSRISSGRREADEALYFFNLFDRLERRAGENNTPEELNELNRDAYNNAMRFRAFVLNLLKSLATGVSFINMKPAYINNMATLAEEYMYLLGKFIEGKNPTHSAIAQDIFWLPMLYAEARYIADNVGLFQRELKNKAEETAADLSYYFMYAVELQSTMRIGSGDYQILKQYRRKLLPKLEEFHKFVQELIVTHQRNGLPGTVSLLQLDSLARKLCYYINQLAVTSEVLRPSCNAYSVRLSTT